MYITRCTLYIPGGNYRQRSLPLHRSAPDLEGLLLPEGSRTLTRRVNHSLFRDGFLQASSYTLNNSALVYFFTSTEFHMQFPFGLHTRCGFCFTAYVPGVGSAFYQRTMYRRGCGAGCQYVSRNVIMTDDSHRTHPSNCLLQSDCIAHGACA